MTKRQTITAVIPALNEQGNITRCLESLSWCDKIQVLWMGDDQTGEISKRLGAEVIRRNSVSSADWIKVQENINWAIDHCQTDWILRVDADEEVTPELQKEIQAILSSPSNFVAYGIPRNQYFFDGFLKGGDWAYDRLVRLFRRGAAYYGKFVHNHEQFQVNGHVGYLTGRLNHYSHPTLTVAMEKFNSYTATEILDHHDSYASALYKLFTQPPYIFLRWLIWHKGFRDGLRGVVAAAYRAWYEFMLWSKYLETYETKNN